MGRLFGAFAGGKPATRSGGRRGGNPAAGCLFGWAEPALYISECSRSNRIGLLNGPCRIAHLRRHRTIPRLPDVITKDPRHRRRRCQHRDPDKIAQRSHFGLFSTLEFQVITIFIIFSVEFSFSFPRLLLLLIRSDAPRSFVNHVESCSIFSCYRRDRRIRPLRD